MQIGVNCHYFLYKEEDDHKNKRKETPPEEEKKKKKTKGNATGGRGKEGGTDSLVSGLLYFNSLLLYKFLIDLD